MKALKISLALTALVLAAAPAMAQTRSNATPPKSPGASEYAPGQLKQEKGGSATDYAPGQTDKGEKGASTNSPGHKMQNFRYALGLDRIEQWYGWQALSTME